MMDGTITVKSEFGKGSTFTVRLRQQYASDGTIGEEVVNALKKLDYSIHKFENAKMTRVNLSYARVLIVDDNLTNLDVAKGLMGLYGMSIDSATGGRQAVDNIRQAMVQYDAIFMDHMMPEMDGVEATRIIREEIGTEYAKNVPIIALTANAIVGNEEMFLGKGFQAFIAKPIDIARLDIVLRQWVRNKEIEATLSEKTINIQPKLKRSRRLLYDDIPELDMDKGIAHFGFSEEAYFKVLGSFVKNTRPLLDIVRGAGEESMEIYGITVHGIKGASRGIYAERIGNAAEALEKAALDRNHDFIAAHNQGFIEMINRLMSDIEYTLAGSGMKQKPAKDKPDDSLLAKLLDACINFDIDEIDAAMAMIESFEYNADNGLTTWIRESLDRGQYKSVKDKLSTLVTTTEVEHGQ